MNEEFNSKDAPFRIDLQDLVCVCGVGVVLIFVFGERFVVFRVKTDHR